MCRARGTWSEQTGAAGDNTFFMWASAGKSLTAVTILQLAQEGRISLDDPISKWVGDVPNGDAITIRHLLTHTSGLFSANEDLVVYKNPRHLALPEEISILQRHGALFCPGENWHYSNSGYDLLGVVIEKSKPNPMRTSSRARIAGPLGLQHLRAVGPGDNLAGVVLPVTTGSDRAIDPHEPGAAGGVVASAADMAIYGQALFSGRLLHADTFKAMFADLYPMFGEPAYYGEGIMVYRLPDGAIWIGHSGGAPGASGRFLPTVPLTMPSLPSRSPAIQARRRRPISCLTNYRNTHPALPFYRRSVRCPKTTGSRP